MFTPGIVFLWAFLLQGLGGAVAPSHPAPPDVICDALQPPDISLPFCCLAGYSPVLLHTPRVALHLHLLLLNCTLLLPSHFSGTRGRAL